MPGFRGKGLAGTVDLEVGGRKMVTEATGKEESVQAIVEGEEKRSRIQHPATQPGQGRWKLRLVEQMLQGKMESQKERKEEMASRKRDWPPR